MRALKTEPADRWFSVDEFWGAMEKGVQAEARPAEATPSRAEQLPGRCGDCGLVNAEDVRFCEGCGAGLFQKCPKCEREVRTGTEFCGGCGVKIAEERSYQDHLSRAQSLLKELKFSRARKEAELALEARPGDPAAQAVVDEANAKRREIEEIRESCPAALSRGEFADAESLIQVGLALVPGDEQFVGWLQELPRRRAAWEIAELAKELSRARDEARLDDAIAVAGRIATAGATHEWPQDSPEAAALEEAAALVREIGSRREEQGRRVQTAQSLLGDGRLEQAGQALSQVDAAYLSGEDRPVFDRTQKLLAEAEGKARRLEKALSGAREALAREEFDRARTLADEIRSLAPQSAELEELQRAIRLGRVSSRVAQFRAQQQDARTDQAWAQVIELHEQIAAALASLKGLAPDDDLQAQADVSSQLHAEAREKLDQLEDALRLAESDAAGHQYEAALARLDQAESEHPQDPRIADARGRIEAQRDQVAQHLAEGRRALDAGSLAGVSRALRGLQDPVVSGIPEAAELVRKLEDHLRRLQAARRRRMAVTAIVSAVVIVAVVLGVTALINRGHLSSSRAELAQGRHEAALDRWEKSRGIGVGSAERQGLGEDIAAALLADERGAPAGDQRWEWERRRCERVTSMKEAPAASAAAGELLADLEERASSAVAQIEAEAGRRIEAGEFDLAEREIARIEVVQPKARQTAAGLTSRVQAARHAARVGELVALIEEDLGQRTDASLNTAERAIGELAAIAPSDGRLAGYRERVQSGRQALERERQAQAERERQAQERRAQEERERQAAITSAISSIESGISTGTRSSLDTAESSLRRLGELEPGHSRISGFRDAIAGKRRALPPPPGTREQATFEIAPGVRMDFVWIPAGTFRMGSPASEKDRRDNEGPVHEVQITKGFWLGKYEVTQEQWQGVMGSNPSGFNGNSRLPVEQVSWNDIQGFIGKLRGPGYRLPTEAEWEYACRAGTTTPFNTGNCLSTSQANYNGNYPYSGCSKGEYRQKTTPVGSFAANAWGLHDMHGNVWEWCSDWYGENYYASSPGVDPRGPSSGTARVLRGGSWDYYARYCRSAFRIRGTPDSRFSLIGFRLTRTAD